MKPGTLLIDNHDINDIWTFVVYLGVIETPDKDPVFAYLLRDGTISTTFKDISKNGWYYPYKECEE